MVSEGALLGGGEGSSGGGVGGAGGDALGGAGGDRVGGDGSGDDLVARNDVGGVGPTVS